MRKNLIVTVLSLVLLLSFTTIALGCPVPEVASVSPNNGLNNQSVNIVVSGAKFHKSAYVKLTKAGQPDIVATNLEVAKEQITCAVDLSGKAEGQWDVVVVNIGSMSKKEKPAVLAGAFTINAPAVKEVKPEPTPEQQLQPTLIPTPVVKVDPNKDLKPIYFDFDKSNIRDDQTSALDLNVRILKDNPDLHIVLGGHADERGAKDYNIQLSSRRAQSVKKYLVDNGIDANRIVIYAYGEEYPLATGHDESSWWQNRRVDVSLWESVPTKEQALEKGTK